MAGGITLLSVMLLFLDPLVAIPVHGVVQLVSNGSRTFIQRQHVQWWIFARYAAPLIPMGFVGIEIAHDERAIVVPLSYNSISASPTFRKGRKSSSWESTLITD